MLVVVMLLALFVVLLVFVGLLNQRTNALDFIQFNELI